MQGAGFVGYHLAPIFAQSELNKIPLRCVYFGILHTRHMDPLFGITVLAIQMGLR